MIGALSGIDGVSSSSNAQAIDSPDPDASWTFSLNELNANGCAGGGTNSLCSQWTAAGYGVPVLPAGTGTIYRWTFAFDKPAPADEVVHIKYEFVRTVAAGNKAAGSKIGSLGSWDINVQRIAVPDGGMTLGLLACALVGLGVLRKRFGVPARARPAGTLPNYASETTGRGVPGRRKSLQLS